MYRGFRVSGLGLRVEGLGLFANVSEISTATHSSMHLDVIVAQIHRTSCLHVENAGCASTQHSHSPVAGPIRTPAPHFPGHKHLQK